MSLNDERDSPEQDSEEYKFDWSVYGDHEHTTTSLEGKDVLALFIASLQTIFLPLVILAIFLFLLGLIAGIFF